MFYFRDMAVLKVMFTAVLVAMLGLQYAGGLGLIKEEQLFFMPSIYGAQIVGRPDFRSGLCHGRLVPGDGCGRSGFRPSGRAGLPRRRGNRERLLQRALRRF